MSNKKVFKYSNETKNVTSQCKVVVYQWNTLLDNPEISDQELSQATRLDISSQVTSVTFGKNMGQPCGNFSITLSNSPNYGTNDWKDIIKRGYWIMIYMSQDGDLNLNPEVGPNLAKNKKAEAKKIRGICYVDRVGVQVQAQENQSLEVGFQVTGRDIGVVYESTEIWHNIFKFDDIMLKATETLLDVVGLHSVDETMQTIHDLFYYPSNLPNGAKAVNDQKSLTSIALQWLLPREMVSDMGVSLSTIQGGTYWGNLNLTDFHKSNCHIAISNPVSYLTGNAWSQLKRLAIPQFHELFLETDDGGTPFLTFRPIPWGIDNSKYPKNSSNITLYKDIEDVVLVPGVDVISIDLGEDDYARYNSFLACVSTTLMNVEDNIGYLRDSGFPKQNQSSIKRHGFRPMHVQVDSLVKNEELANGTADKDALIEFNEILYDYWNNAVYAESGSCDKIGSNDIKIGKVLKFKDDVPYCNRKRYYIEGYLDTFMVTEKGVGEWTQNVSLTRGFEESDLVAKKGFSSRSDVFVGAGEYTRRNGGK